MIVGDLKPITEIVAAIAGCRKVLISGCGSCVSVCLSGGDREASLLAASLAKPGLFEGHAPQFEVDTVLRQCEQDLIETYHPIPADVDAVLSLACGAGVQTMADAVAPVPVYPGLNTTFLGASSESGIWREMCQGCGDCLLGITGGICPVARCAKSLFNGPCGGSQGSSCEINPDTPCAWGQIYERLKLQNKLHLLEKVRRTKDWRPGGAAGPRLRQRTGTADAQDGSE